MADSRMNIKLALDNKEFNTGLIASKAEIESTKTSILSMAGTTDAMGEITAKGYAIRDAMEAMAELSALAGSKIVGSIAKTSKVMLEAKIGAQGMTTGMATLAEGATLASKALTLLEHSASAAFYGLDAQDVYHRLSNAAEKTYRGVIEWTNRAKESFESYVASYQNDPYVHAAAQAEEYQKQLKTLSGSEKQAREEMEQMYKVASDSKFSIDSIVEAGIQLNEFDQSIEKTLPLIEGLAEITGQTMPRVAQIFGNALKNPGEGLALLSKRLHITKDDIIQFGAQVDDNGKILNETMGQTKKYTEALLAAAQAKINKGDLEKSATTIDEAFQKLHNTTEKVVEVIGSSFSKALINNVEAVNKLAKGVLELTESAKPLIGTFLKWGGDGVEFSTAAMVKLVDVIHGFVDGAQETVKVANQSTSSLEKMGAAAKMVAPLIAGIGTAAAIAAGTGGLFTKLSESITGVGLFARASSASLGLLGSVTKGALGPLVPQLGALGLLIGVAAGGFALFSNNAGDSITAMLAMTAAAVGVKVAMGGILAPFTLSNSIFGAVTAKIGSFTGAVAEMIPKTNLAGRAIAGTFSGISKGAEQLASSSAFVGTMTAALGYLAAAALVAAGVYYKFNQVFEENARLEKDYIARQDYIIKSGEKYLNLLGKTSDQLLLMGKYKYDKGMQSELKQQTDDLNTELVRRKKVLDEANEKVRLDPNPERKKDKAQAESDMKEWERKLSDHAKAVTALTGPSVTINDRNSILDRMKEENSKLTDEIFKKEKAYKDAQALDVQFNTMSDTVGASTDNVRTEKAKKELEETRKINQFKIGLNNNYVKNLEENFKKIVELDEKEGNSGQALLDKLSKIEEDHFEFEKNVAAGRITLQSQMAAESEKIWKETGEKRDKFESEVRRKSELLERAKVSGGDVEKFQKDLDVAKKALQDNLNLYNTYDKARLAQQRESLNQAVEHKASERNIEKQLLQDRIQAWNHEEALGRERIENAKSQYEAMKRISDLEIADIKSRRDAQLKPLAESKDLTKEQNAQNAKERVRIWTEAEGAIDHIKREQLTRDRDYGEKEREITAKIIEENNALIGSYKSVLQAKLDVLQTKYEKGADNQAEIQANKKAQAQKEIDILRSADKVFQTQVHSDKDKLNHARDTENQIANIKTHYALDETRFAEETNRRINERKVKLAEIGEQAILNRRMEYEERVRSGKDKGINAFEVEEKYTKDILDIRLQILDTEKKIALEGKTGKDAANITADFEAKKKKARLDGEKEQRDSKLREKAAVADAAEKEIAENKAVLEQKIATGQAGVNTAIKEREVILDGLLARKNALIAHRDEQIASASVADKARIQRDTQLQINQAIRDSAKELQAVNDKYKTGNTELDKLVKKYDKIAADLAAIEGKIADQEKEEEASTTLPGMEKSKSENEAARDRKKREQADAEEAIKKQKQKDAADAQRIAEAEIAFQTQKQGKKDGLSGDEIKEKIKENQQAYRDAQNGPKKGNPGATPGSPGAGTPGTDVGGPPSGVPGAPGTPGSPTTTSPPAAGTATNPVMTSSSGSSQEIALLTSIDAGIKALVQKMDGGRNGNKSSAPAPGVPGFSDIGSSVNPNSNGGQGSLAHPDKKNFLGKSLNELSQMDQFALAPFSLPGTTL
jgi:hypothetical protein